MSTVSDLLEIPIRKRTTEDLHTLIEHPEVTIAKKGQCRAELDRRSRLHAVRITAISAFLGAAVGAVLTSLLS